MSTRIIFQLRLYLFSRIIYVVYSAKPDHMDVAPGWSQISGLTVLMDLKFRVNLAANILTLSRTKLFHRLWLRVFYFQ